MNRVVKIIFVAIVFLNAPILVYSQAVTWQKWYDYNHREEIAFDALQTYDGGYAVLGLALYTADSVELIKLDYLGNIKWKKVYGDSLASPIPRSLQQTNDSGFVIAGGVGSRWGFLTRLDKDGNLLWKKYYKKNNLDTRFFDCKITNDGGIIATGDIFPSTNGGGYVIKTNMLGKLEWDNVYSSHVFDVVNSKLDNCLYLLSGQIITKVDSIGKIIWEKNISPFFMNEIVQHASGFIFAAGGSDSINLIKLDSSGNTIWIKGYYKNATAFSVCIGKDQNILVVGGVDTLGQYDFAAVKVNINGDQIFTRKINTVPGDWYKIPSSVRSTGDYGYIMSGSTDYPGGSYNDNLIVVKTDSTCYAPKIVGVNNQQAIVQDNFFLYQNYPNPFNPSTKINYTLNFSGKIQLVIYSITGKEVETLVNDKQYPGTYSVSFDPQKLNLPTGIYLYKFSTGNYSRTRKMLYIK